MEKQRNMRKAGGSSSLHTRLVNVTQQKDPYGASVPPLYQSTTFKQESFEPGCQEYDYTRSGNPTRSVVERQVGKLYGVCGEQVLAVSSGMSALDVILRSILGSYQAGKTPVVIAGDDLYGGTQRLLGILGIQGHVKVLHVDTSDAARFVDVFLSQRNVACVLLESPTNPLMKVADLPKLISFVKSHRGGSGCKIVVDNTMVSGINCNPLELGADLVYESATKFLNGHHDIMAGVIVAASVELAQDMYFIVNSMGAGLAPMDSWLLIRGLKTLGVRMYQQQHNAMVLAHWLQDSCGFAPTEQNSQLRTRFVGLKSHPQFHLHRSFNSGPGAVLSIETGDIELSEKIVCSKKFKYWNVTVSFGCVNSLISMPCKMSHASIDPELRKDRKFPEDLIRICCGIEDVSDLQWDLLGAFEDVGLLELRDNRNTIFNKLNGHLAKNTIGQTVYNKNIYDAFFGEKIANAPGAVYCSAKL
ncbi:cystathionine beta-lyase STR3 Ecym_8405 [Eremothecium cymbalariae DBVPG|uniref:Cystathionine beta-lyase n=1 Tax=Eremothecium cymbalariae (strain CBS 270.75 / DBVPG 7215 / KCTC 17166 / NRRL Y-17582) TaxID=931890 RepID=G8JXV1_ERECY|nr:Hypothetical protein Ecym_8405 [Eremothecium cymbalariae DBVPG\